MDWNDAMGWKFPEFAALYGIAEYLMPPLMGTLDHGQALSEEGMAQIYIIVWMCLFYLQLVKGLVYQPFRSYVLWCTNMCN